MAAIARDNPKSLSDIHGAVLDAGLAPLNLPVKCHVRRRMPWHLP
jgi:hypothetical protein